MIIIRDVQGGVSIPCLSKRTISGRPLILGLVQEDAEWRRQEAELEITVLHIPG